MQEHHTTKHVHNFQDLTGQVFGRLTAQRYIGKDKFGRVLWSWLCECGEMIIRTANTVKQHHTNSCGCLKRDVTAARTKTHGASKTSEYTSWQGIIYRCENTKHRWYPKYGGRGISVCLRWRSSFENFLADMGLKPSPQHSIERIDNDGNYEPKNCKWATGNEQMRNTRRTRLITFNNETMCALDWAARCNISRATLDYRLEYWPLERALTEMSNYRNAISSLRL